MWREELRRYLCGWAEWFVTAAGLLLIGFAGLTIIFFTMVYGMAFISSLFPAL